MKKRYFILILLSVLALNSCDLYEDNNETLGQITSAVIKSPDADFSQYRTFAITDSVLFVNNKDSKRTKTEFSDLIVNCVSEEFETIGYKKITEGDPDLIIDLTYFELRNTTVIFDPYYWWDWAWWWDYCPYYPYDPFYPYYPYPMPSYYSSYTTGSLVIETVDMTRLEKEHAVPIVWHAVVRSILGASHSKAEIKEAVDECFTILPPVNSGQYQSKK